MDDRDLEELLRGRLQRRFDGAAPSTDLANGVAQLYATRPQRLGWGGVGSRRVSLGRLLVGAAGIIAVAVTAVNIGARVGPAAPRPTPTLFLATPPPPERQFVVMVAAPGEAAKEELNGVADLLAARISALGVGNWSSYTGYGTVFSIPLGGPSDDLVRDVLRAPGDIAFVPLPAGDYGDGGLVAEPGKPLPKAEPALFGWEGIESTSRTATEPPTTTIVLKPAAADAFAAYTSAHVGEQFAILVDGVVGFAAFIQAPITGGQLELSSGGANADQFQRTTAILAGGKLPDKWGTPDVPVIISEDAAAAAALRYRPSAAAGPRSVDVVPDGQRWRAVWNVTLYGDFPDDCPLASPFPSDCPAASSVVVTVDAVTGAFISSEVAAP